MQKGNTYALFGNDNVIVFRMRNMQYIFLRRGYG